MRVPARTKQKVGYGHVDYRGRKSTDVNRRVSSGMRSHAVRQLAPFVLLFLVFTVIFATRPLVAGASPVFLTTQGSKFMYQGQTVLLRGENFNNEPANSCCGGPDINKINANLDRKSTRLNSSH